MTTAARPELDLSIYLVTDAAQIASSGHTIIETVSEAVAGGVTCVQVRDKHASGGAFLSTVLKLAAVLPADVGLIVNDRIDVFCAARQAGARVSGVHVGQSDLPAELVRSLIGPDAVLGLSAATPEEIAAAEASGCVDHLGVGAIRATATKADAPPALGVDGFADLVSLSDLPAVAIGGVSAADLPGLRAAGAAGAAVVSAICAQADPRAAARTLARAWRTE